MSFDMILNRSGLPQPSELSSLASQREPKSLSQMWKIVRDYQKQIHKLTNVVSQLQLQQGQSNGVKTGMHPFKIYQFPDYLRAYHNDDDWRRFKVRGGNYGGPLSIVNGTDRQVKGSDSDTFLEGNQSPPTSAIAIDPYGTWNEAIIPDADGTEIWFWVSIVSYLVDGTPEVHPPVIRYGPDQGFGDPDCTAVDLYSGDTMQEPLFRPSTGSDPYRTIIGRVRLNFGTQIKNQPCVYQMVNEDIIPTENFCLLFGGVIQRGYVGLYDLGTTYFAGDIVSTDDDDGHGNHTLSLWFMNPPNGSLYEVRNGPIINIDPRTNTPDPWLLISKSGAQADYHNGAYDGTKYYLRT